MADKKCHRNLLTRKQVAQRLGLSENTLAKWAMDKNARLPYFLIGNRARYDDQELEQFITSCRRKSSREGGAS